MPNLLDIFNDDAYSTFELTDTIDMLPFQPQRIGSMGLFEESGISTLYAGIERRGSKIALIPIRDRGVHGVVMPKAKRDLRYFEVPHIPAHDFVYADDLIGQRMFGQESGPPNITGMVNDKMENMKTSIEVTKEYHRVGAVQGQIKDADGTTVIWNLFTEFGYTETVIDFNLDNVATDVNAKASLVRKTMKGQMGGGVMFRGIHAFVGDAFWDALVSHPNVKDAYINANKGEFLLEDQRAIGGFEFAGIFWEPYEGFVGDVPFIPADDARFVPLGVRGLFKQYNAPANWMEAVGTIGKPIYAKVKPLEDDTGAKILGQANPLIICTRPNLLIKGTRT